MIPANELRIGNLVLVGDKPTVVESVDPQGINSSISHGYYPGETEIEYVGQFHDWPGYVTIGGIPLTEEWLLKFGFEKDDSNVYFIPDVKTIIEGFDAEPLFDFGISRNDKGEFIITNGAGLDEYVVSKPFLYVHQLQNLYFALTGTELELKKYPLDTPSQ